MNGAIKRRKQLHQFTNMLLATFFVLFNSFLFSFSFLNYLREISQNLFKEMVHPQDFVLMNPQN